LRVIDSIKSLFILLGDIIEYIVPIPKL